MAEPSHRSLGTRTPARTGLRFRRRQVRATIERHPDYFPIYTVGRPLAPRRRALDRLVRRVPRRDDVAHRPSGPATPGGGATAEHYSRLLEHQQHDRDVHDLGFIFLNTYLPWYELTGDERAPPGPDHRRADPGPAVQSRGAVPPLVRGAREPVHRHHDERADHLLRRPRDRRPGALRPGRRPLPDHRADPGPPRRRRRRTRGSSTSTPARSSASRPIRGSAPTRTGPAAWPGRSTASARSSPTRTTRPTWPSPSGTPTTSSRAARRAWSPPGTSTSPPAPTGSTTARPPRSPRPGLWNLARLTEPSRPRGRRYRDARPLHDPRLPLHRPLPRLG